MTEGAPRNKFDSRSVDSAGGTTSPASRNTGRSRVSQDPPMPITVSAQLLNPAYITGEQWDDMGIGHNCKSASFERAKTSTWSHIVSIGTNPDPVMPVEEYTQIF